MESSLSSIITELLEIIEIQISLITKNKISDLGHLTQKEEKLVVQIECLKKSHNNIKKDVESLNLIYKLRTLIHKRDYLIRQNLLASKKMFSFLEKECSTYTSYKKNSNKNKKNFSIISTKS